MRENFKVKTIGVFGSYVRGEQKKKSDVDVVIEFEEPVGLFELWIWRITLLGFWMSRLIWSPRKHLSLTLVSVFSRK